jgi:hypothetical protein
LELLIFEKASKNLATMKNRKKLAKGVVALSMALSFGTAILAPTHEAVASCGCKNKACVYTVPEPGSISVACKDTGSMCNAGSDCLQF